jgi:hypothetical protein
MKAGKHVRVDPDKNHPDVVVITIDHLEDVPGSFPAGNYLGFLVEDEAILANIVVRRTGP